MIQILNFIAFNATNFRIITLGGLEMLRIVAASLFALAAFVAPAWAIDVGHDCAEGSDEYIVADTKPTPPAGV